MPAVAPFITIVRTRLACALLTSCLLLAGCGGMSGTYENAESGNKIEFTGDSVYVTIAPAPTIAGTYEIDGEKVILKMEGQSIVLTRKGSSLEGGPFGMTFARK